MAETIKSKARREREGWFNYYIKPSILDIGCGNDPVTPDCDKWDQALGHGDATYMHGICDESYQTVYASHIIEHLNDPIEGIRNWYRLVKRGGHLIIVAPHRDLYEKQRMLPSRWNGDHKTFWLPTECDPPHTFSLKHVVQQALKDFNYDIKLFQVAKEGWEPVPVTEHSHGEYSIECVIYKF